MKNVIGLGIVALCFLSGCQSTALTPDELSKNYVGPQPENYQQIITTWFGNNLKDPYSAHYDFQDPYAGKMWTGLLNSGYDYGWICVVDVNAKNSYGGYTGKQTYNFLIRNGQVVFVQGPPPE